MFVDPSTVIRADHPQDVLPALEAMQKARDNGKWLAGYFSYELGYALSDKLGPLMPETRELPLLHFGVFDRPVAVEKNQISDTAQLSEFKPTWDFPRYAAAFETLHDYIKAGHIYQVNLTFALESQLTGDINTLYAQLQKSQPVPHGVLVDFEGTTLLSRSPELFFSLSSSGTLTTRPMKGTAPRGATVAEDDALRDGLQASEKNRAENLMIVDLLRNDMSRVSKIGSVKVPDLFTVERYATLHQMTSRITSKVENGCTIKDLICALFPCGSITGAPKMRAMEIIHDVEQHPREAYCGSIGWIAPDTKETGTQDIIMEFNVAIRTLHCRADKSVRLNVGGGVVYDSTAEGEYGEAILKGNFAIK